MVRASSSGLSSVLAGGADTIVACATAPGRGALAVIRVSGPQATALANGLVGTEVQLEPWRARLVSLRDREGEVLDRAVAISFPGPRSYTGEDMVELTVHGSVFVVGEVMAAFEQAGARRAEPGEFTRRAVANGKMDLIQAEAVRDMIDAETALQARTARAQVDGVLSTRFRDLRRSLVHLLAVLEANLDFADQGLSIEAGPIRVARQSCRELIRSLLGSASAGRLVRDGARVVIIGRPNAGKSTLFNRLVGSARSIVDSQPGTTRDLVEAEVEIAGLKVILSDTAGLRETSAEVESEGVRRAEQAAAAAALVLLLWSVEGEDEPPAAPTGVPLIKILSKVDLVAEKVPAEREGWLAVSAAEETGLVDLRRTMAQALGASVAGLDGEVAITARHEASLSEADRLLTESIGELEIEAQHTRWALDVVARLIGEVDDEAVLDEVFATFCVGK